MRACSRLLQKEMMGTALIHKQELEKQTNALNQSAARVDDRLKTAGL
jgi:hypothetical protein